MRTALLSTAVMCFGLATPSSAQQWTPEQQSVLNDLESCWDTWTESVRQGDPSLWIDQCTDGDFRYWWTADGAPASPAFLLRNWERVQRTNGDWKDIRPLVIKIVDEVAIMHFYGYWDVQTPDGPLLTEGMRMEVFHRVNGRWLLVAGQGTPSSAEMVERFRR